MIGQTITEANILLELKEGTSDMSQNLQKLSKLELSHGVKLTLQS